MTKRADRGGSSDNPALDWVVGLGFQVLKYRQNFQFLGISSLGLIVWAFSSRFYERTEGPTVHKL